MVPSVDQNSAPFYKVMYYTKWVTTSWTYSTTYSTFGTYQLSVDVCRQGGVGCQVVSRLTLPAWRCGNLEANGLECSAQNAAYYQRYHFFNNPCRKKCQLATSWLVAWSTRTTKANMGIHDFYACTHVVGSNAYSPGAASLCEKGKVKLLQSILSIWWVTTSLL